MTVPTPPEEAESLALDHTCPRPECRAGSGERCTYALAIREDETGRFIRWYRITRSAHHERIAVATDGRVYGYALRSLEKYLARALPSELEADYRKGRK